MMTKIDFALSCCRSTKISKNKRKLEFNRRLRSHFFLIKLSCYNIDACFLQKSYDIKDSPDLIAKF